MSREFFHAKPVFFRLKLSMLGLAVAVWTGSIGLSQDEKVTVEVPFAEAASGDESATADGDKSPLMPPGEVPSGGVTAEAGASEAGSPEAMPPIEYNEEEKALIAKFEAEERNLAEQMGDMREIYVKFMNGIDSSRDAESRYREARNNVRKQFNATYDSAIEIIRRVPHDVAVQFIATWIQNREANDIYDRDTFEGAARLIDGGINYMFLFLAAARSAVVSGDFKQAKLLYEAMDLEKMEKHDQALFYQLDILEENWKKEQIALAADEANGQLPRVLLKTTRGDAVLELFIDSAPQTVANFINLVEEGFYDGLEFYQVIAHLLALTGDPSGLGSGNTGKFLPDEHERSDARMPMRGSLMMAKIPMGDTGKFVPNSASCQFAILLLPLNAAKEQTVFGRVVEGMDVISSLRRVDPSKEKKKGAVQVPPDRILTAEVIRRPTELPTVEFVTPGVK
jgi:cyclophilin family peptidyl-prolyl cis-trans isomerase